MNNYVQQQLQNIPPSSHVTPLQVCQTLHWLALGMKAHHQILFALDELQPDWLPNERRRQEAEERVKLFIIAAYMLVGQLNGILLQGFPILSEEVQKKRFPSRIQKNPHPQGNLVWTIHH
jgi:hypothetical protein